MNLLSPPSYYSGLFHRCLYFSSRLSKWLQYGIFLSNMAAIAGMFFLCVIDHIVICLHNVSLLYRNIGLRIHAELGPNAFSIDSKYILKTLV